MHQIWHNFHYDPKVKSKPCTNSEWTSEWTVSSIIFKGQESKGFIVYPNEYPKCFWMLFQFQNFMYFLLKIARTICLLYYKSVIIVLQLRERKKLD